MIKRISRPSSFPRSEAVLRGIRFVLRGATLYAFWVSRSPRGESRGYVAAGGPAYPGLRDL